jgi:cytochrome c oxidase assembly factor CtaG
MDSTVHLLIELLCLCGIIGVIWWIFNRIPMPEPLKIVAEVVIGIIAIVMLLHIAGWDGGVALR